MTCTSHLAAVTTARQMSQGGICCYLNKVILDLSYLLSVKDFYKQIFIPGKGRSGGKMELHKCVYQQNSKCASECSQGQKHLSDQNRFIISSLFRPPYLETQSVQPSGIFCAAYLFDFFQTQLLLCSLVPFYLYG